MTNRYPGINPHLNSFLQHKTGWKGFHTHHLADLSKMIDPLLPDAYYIADEESLQIGIYDRFAWNLVQTEEPEYISSLVIYRLEDGVFPGVPVTRIELLSPANKSPGSHAEKYRLKREETLRSGLRLVEIDYLHQQPPITGAIPNYQTEQLNAFFYYIAVSDHALRLTGD